MGGSQFLLFTHNNEYYLFISNRYQSGEKQKEGAGNHSPPLERLKLLRIPCPSPLWALGVESERTETGHD